MMTLHEAIQRVLEQEKRSLTASEIAEVLNIRKWYSKKDSSTIDSSQISARVNKATIS